MWHVIRVKETDKEEEAQSCFIFCNKKWPEKTIFMEDTFYECARGREDVSTIGQECLFTVSICNEQFNRDIFEFTGIIHTHYIMPEIVWSY